MAPRLEFRLAWTGILELAIFAVCGCKYSSMGCGKRRLSRSHPRMDSTWARRGPFRRDGRRVRPGSVGRVAFTGTARAESIVSKHYHGLSLRQVLRRNSI